MSGENTEVEQVEQIGTAAFAAGFDEDEDQVQQPTETPAVADPALTPVEETPAPPEYVQITKDEWSTTQARAAKVDEIEATWTKRMDQAFGKMGGLERKFAELQSTTPLGQAVQVDESDFEDMVREYPELASHQIKGLNKALSKLKGTGGGFDQAAVEKIVSAATESLRVDLTLEQVLPQWKKQVNTPEFKSWVSSSKGWDTRLDDKAFVTANLADANSPLSQFVKANPEDPVSLYLSSDVEQAAKMLKQFKERNAAPVPSPSPAPKAATPAQPSIRQRQIAAAVAPKSEGASPPSAGKSPFLAGYEDED